MIGTVKRPKIYWVDAAKGLSIVLVVLYHTHYWLNEAGVKTSSPLQVNEALAEMRMPIFFFAAGLFAAKYFVRNWRILLASKILLIGWVFAVWQVISTGYSFLAGVVLFDQSVAESGLKALAKIPLAVVRPGNELWFLWALGVMFVLCKVFLLIPWQARLSLALVPAIVLQAVPGEIEEALVEAVGLGWLGLGKYFVFFLAASLLGRGFAERVASVPRLGAVAVLVVAAPLMVLSQFVDVGLANFLFTLSGLAAGMCAALLLSWVEPLRTLGANTLPVYVLHTSLLVIISVCISAAPSITNLGAVWPVAIALATVLLTTIAATTLRRAGGSSLFEPPTKVVAWADRRLAALN